MGLEQLFTSAFIITWLAASVRLAGPVLLAALGEIFDELGGILNIGIEGTILLGALTSFLISFLIGNAWLGVLGAIIVGIISNLFLAWMYITVRANQVVVGIIFNLLALGLTSYTFRAVLGTQARPQKATMIETLDIPILSDLPFFGPDAIVGRSVASLTSISFTRHNPGWTMAVVIAGKIFRRLRVAPCLSGCHAGIYCLQP